MEENDGQRPDEEGRAEGVLEVELALVDARGHGHHQGQKMTQYGAVQDVLEPEPPEQEPQQEGQAHVPEAEDDEEPGS